MKLAGISDNTKHGAALCEALYALLAQQKSSYEAKLIPDLSYLHSLARCEGGINIVSIKHHFDNQYTLNYQFNWSIYSGCLDINDCGTLKGYMPLTVENDGTILFDFSHFEDRSTADEL